MLNLDGKPDDADEPDRVTELLLPLDLGGSRVGHRDLEAAAVVVTAGRPRSNYCYKRFLRTNQVKQPSLAVRPTPATAGPSRLHYHSMRNVHRYSAGTQTMQQGGQSLPVSDALWSQKEHE